MSLTESIRGLTAVVEQLESGSVPDSLFGRGRGRNRPVLAIDQFVEHTIDRESDEVRVPTIEIPTFQDPFSPGDRREELTPAEYEDLVGGLGEFRTGIDLARRIVSALKQGRITDTPKGTVRIRSPWRIQKRAKAPHEDPLESIASGIHDAEQPLKDALHRWEATAGEVVAGYQRDIGRVSGALERKEPLRNDIDTLYGRVSDRIERGNQNWAVDTLEDVNVLGGRINPHWREIESARELMDGFERLEAHVSQAGMMSTATMFTTLEQKEKKFKQE